MQKKKEKKIIAVEESRARSAAGRKGLTDPVNERQELMMFCSEVLLVL